MAGEESSGGMTDMGWSDLLRADPTHLADAMVLSTENTLSVGEALGVHDGGFEAVTLAYEHVVVNAVGLARELRAIEAAAEAGDSGNGESSPASWAQISLRLRATVDVAGRLAVRIVGHEGNRTPPTWSNMLDAIVTREDPGADADTEPIGPFGLDVRARIRTSIGLYRRSDMQLTELIRAEAAPAEDTTTA